MGLSLFVPRDMAETIHPHPSTRGGVVGGDVAVEVADVVVGGHDVVA